MRGEALLGLPLFPFGLDPEADEPGPLHRKVEVWTGRTARRPGELVEQLDGVARAFAVLRDAGLVQELSTSVDVLDYGDVSLPEPSQERDPPPT